MSVKRRRIARGIATVIIAAFVCGGLAYIGRDVAVNPPQSEIPITEALADSTRIRSGSQPKDSTRKKKKKKESAPTRKPAQRDFLNEPVNR